MSFWLKQTILTIGVPYQVLMLFQCGLIIFFIVYILQLRIKLKKLKFLNHWWILKLNARQTEQSNVLREVVLQDLFSLRRRLEILSLSNSSSIDYREFIDRLTTIHKQIDQLSEEISTSFGDTELGLILQNIITSYPLQKIDIKTKINRDKSWIYNSKDTVFISYFFKEMANLLFCDPSLYENVKVMLSEEPKMLIELTMRYEMPESIIKELSLLFELFKEVKHGHISQKHEKKMYKYTLDW